MIYEFRNTLSVLSFSMVRFLSGSGVCAAVVLNGVQAMIQDLVFRVGAQARKLQNRSQRPGHIQRVSSTHGVTHSYLSCCLLLLLLVHAVCVNSLTGNSGFYLYA